MKKAVFITPHVWAFFGLPILSFLAGILLLVLKEWYPALACFIICIIFILPLIIWKKWFFMKILINENGLKTFYKNFVFSEIKWEEIADAKVTTITSNDALISFSAKENAFLNMKELVKDKSVINVRLKSPQGNSLMQYKKNIPIQIRGLEKLPKNLKDKFI